MIIEGRALVRGSLQDCCIRVEHGKIVEVKRTIKGDDRLRLRGTILPAGIDLHVHFREPGMTRKEDFSTGTAAAACGGIACVVDMPNTRPPTTTPARVREKIEIVQKKASVDFGLYAGLTEDSDIEGLAEVATGLKAYLASSTGELAIEFDGLLELRDELSATGKFLSIHSEDPEQTIDIEERRLEDHVSSRPDTAEVGGIEMAKRLAGVPRIHIAHVSSEKGLAALAGSGFTSEVTPHHLLLNVNSSLGSLAKVNPPIRFKNDQNALWAAFVAGHIDIIASDHAPHTLDEKEQDFSTAPAGVPGVETMMPLLLERVRHRSLTLERLVKAACERPAELLGLEKGRIEAGYDADLIAVDMKKSRRIRADDLHSRCGWTPYEGMNGVFPHAMMVRGVLVAENGEIVSKPSGRYLGAKH